MLHSNYEAHRLSHGSWVDIYKRRNDSTEQQFLECKFFFSGDANFNLMTMQMSCELGSENTHQSYSTESNNRWCTYSFSCSFLPSLSFGRQTILLIPHFGNYSQISQIFTTDQQRIPWSHAIVSRLFIRPGKGGNLLGLGACWLAGWWMIANLGRMQSATTKLIKYDFWFIAAKLHLQAKCRTNALENMAIWFMNELLVMMMMRRGICIG